MVMASQLVATAKGSEWLAWQISIDRNKTMMTPSRLVRSNRPKPPGFSRIIKSSRSSVDHSQVDA